MAFFNRGSRHRLGKRALARTSGAIFALLFGLIAGPAAAASPTVVSPTEPIAVELNEGKLIRLDQPAASVFVANPAIADVSVKSPRLVYLFGSNPGETTVFAVDEDENVIADLKVVVNHNISRLNDAIQQLAPQGVTAQSLDGGIVLAGAVATASQSENIRRLATRFIGPDEEIINQLQVTAPNQVNLRVRIAEVSRQVINRFGFNWEAAYTGSSNFLFGIATGQAVVPLTLFGTQTVSPATAGVLGTGSFLTRQGFETDNLFFRSTAGNFDVNSLVDILAEDGLITILAEPNLTALSGETASFLAGGEFPIPVSQTNNRLTIEFKEFGVSLKFTPTMVGANRISMRVAPEVSQLSNAGAITLQNIQVPALTTRRAETTVELGSGQSFAIAGLLLDNTTHDADEVPGLVDIPILGALFQSDRFERNESELVIIVTPYLVKPAASERTMALPTDPYQNVQQLPTQSNLAVPISQPQIIPLNRGNVAGAAPARPSGFIVE